LRPFSDCVLKLKKGIMIPQEFKNYYLGRNGLFFPGFEFIVKLSYPRVFVKFKKTEGYYTDFDKFFKNVAEVQYLEGKRPSESEQQQILNDVWNFITMEKGSIHDDYVDGNYNS